MNYNVFQYLAILHNDRVTGIRDDKREFGFQIEVRCWDSTDAREAKPTWYNLLDLFQLADALVDNIPSVVSVTYNLTAKPPSTIEAI